MRRPYLILALTLVTLQTTAQVSDAWKTKVESIFQPLNRSFVTTGFLTDYGIYFTNIEKFNGIPSDSNYIEFNEWQELYTTLYSCRFNTNATLQTPASIFGLIDSMAVINSGTILFTGLHYKYERFKNNATPNLVYVQNNKIYDKPGRTTTPYEIKETFAIVPMISSLEGSAHTFLFKPEFYYSNMGKTISTLRVDFGDGGGYRTITPNVPMSILYGSEGEKTIRFKVTYTDNSFKESRTRIEVVNVSPQEAQARYGGLNILEFNFPLQNFHQPKAYQGKVAKSLVTVEYTNPEKKIRKPLIIIEGFDPWKILTPFNPEKNFDFKDIISKDFTGNGLNVLINYTHGATYYATLSDALQGEKYDLIFVDFDNGTDYIQRNAYLVENIIEWVNSVKEPYNGVMQQNVVMGASMGGLVARYALRDMELSTPAIDHETRLYASFDSPHQGANFPMAFQAMVSHLKAVGVGFGLPGMYYFPQELELGSLMPQLGRSYKLLNSPAARQMLYYSVVGSGEFLIANNQIHDDFMADYTAKGSKEAFVILY